MALESLMIALFATILIMSNFFHGGEAVISCGTIESDLFPCLDFVLSGGDVSPDCCSGMKTLLGLAETRADRQSACSCLTSLAGSAPEDELKKAAQIPSLCGINLPFKVSPNIDCSKIH